MSWNCKGFSNINSVGHDLVKESVPFGYSSLAEISFQVGKRTLFAPAALCTGLKPQLDYRGSDAYIFNKITLIPSCPKCRLAHTLNSTGPHCIFVIPTKVSIQLPQ